MWISRAKELGTAILGRVLRRHVVLLPAEAADDSVIASAQGAYRAGTSPLEIKIEEKAAQTMTATLWGYAGHFPRQLLWRSKSIPYDGPGMFRYDVHSGEVQFAGHGLAAAKVESGRRFCWEFEFVANGASRHRMIGHYLPGSDSRAGSDYFTGENYVDYEAQSVGEHVEIMRLIREHHAEGPVLEIGCATGGLLKSLLDAGYDAVGVDISDWAVKQAAQRVPPDRAAVCNFETDSLPATIVGHGPFRTIILWAVLEHFRQPFEVLRRIGNIAAPGARLFINTSNASSLTHHVFGHDWEGYFDWTHHGVEQVTASSLREALVADGWDVVQFTTNMIWDTSADPTHATLREWWSADARFRRLLTERDLGDFITCVAVRR